MPYYEHVFIARQDISSAQVEAITEEMAEIITEDGGTIARREYWGLRSFAYRIKKNRKGHYIMFNLDAPSDAIQEMERNLRLHEDVLRYITIRVDELRAEPSPMAHGKGDRDRAERRSRDSEEEGEPAEQAPMRPPDKYGLDIDSEFRGKVKGKFLGWEEVAKIAFEVILDEMRTLFELSG